MLVVKRRAVADVDEVDLQQQQLHSKEAESWLPHSHADLQYHHKPLHTLYSYTREPCLLSCVFSFSSRSRCPCVERCGLANKYFTTDSKHSDSGKTWGLSGSKLAPFCRVSVASGGWSDVGMTSLAGPACDVREL